MKNRKAASDERLRASPTFALAFSLNGRPYVAQETEPYIQYWLTERYRILLSMFSARAGATTAQAIDAYFRLTRAKRSAAERKRCEKAIDDMRSCGVLMATHDDVSRYDARMARAYLEHRPFPPELAQHIVELAPITAPTRVLDLAGGPGDLAAKLAHASSDVTLMELSRGFIGTARSHAKRRNVNLTAMHESANRLMHAADEYDVVTVSQALHWLDDVQVCRGLCRVLRDGGSFFVVVSAMDLDDAHPLATVFGAKSVLGHKDPRPFAQQIESLMKRLTLLFEALDAPDVQRIDVTQQWAGANRRIVPAGVSLYRQARPFDLGYARAFLTDRHIAPTGRTPAQFWSELEKRCENAAPDELVGAFDWAVLHFRRGGERAALPAFETLPVSDVGWHGPATKAGRRSDPSTAQTRMTPHLSFSLTAAPQLS
jgi:2-polyprenyl-3-methyl-5-hydroxy-6-metoxy-1,4-benzoquinol methylase